MKTKILAILFTAIALIANAQNTCPAVKISDFPKKDFPPADFKVENFKGKTSENYYYGIGVSINYVTARYLAFIEMKDNTDEPALGGSTVLLMLYANGYGVERNFDICIRISCGNLNAAPAEIDGRTQHLKNMAAGKDKGVFDICDDITSGYMQGVCNSIGADKAKYQRQANMDKIVSSLPKEDTAAYRSLRAAASNFFNARSENEVDLSGTMRAVFIQDESDSLERNFMDKIMKSVKCNFQNYSQDDFMNADKELNKVYSQVMKTTDVSGWGTVTKTQIKSVERTWLPYRDAWVAFMKVKCPQLSEYALEALLTKERISQLKGFLSQ